MNLGIWYLVFGIWYLGFGIWYLGFGIWDLGFGIWFLVFGFWFLVFGFWFLAFGFWLLVFDLALDFDLHSPCYRACDDLKSWEILSEDLFEHRDKPCFVWLVRASSTAPNFLKQRRKQAVGGALFFGYLSFEQAKESNSPRGGKKILTVLFFNQTS